MTASTITPAWGWRWHWAISLSIISGLRPAQGDQLRLGKALIAPLDDSARPLHPARQRRATRCCSIITAVRTGFRSRASARSCAATMPRRWFADGRCIIGVTSESVKDTLLDPVQHRLQQRRADMGDHRARPYRRPADPGGDRRRSEPAGSVSRRVEDLWIWGWALAGMALGLLVRNPIPASVGSGPRSAGACRRRIPSFRNGSAAAGGSGCDCLGRLGRADQPDHARGQQPHSRAVAQELRTLSPARGDRPDAGVQERCRSSGASVGKFRCCSPTSPGFTTLSESCRAGISRRHLQ